VSNNRFSKSKRKNSIKIISSNLEISLRKIRKEFTEKEEATVLNRIPE